MRVYIYDRNGNQVNDPSRSAEQLGGVSWATMWPKGYAALTAQVRRDILATWVVKGAYRIIVRDGQRILYEGRLNAPQKQIQSGDSTVSLSALGWYCIFNERTIRKRWIDIEGLPRLVSPPSLVSDYQQNEAQVDRGNDKITIRLVRVDTDVNNSAQYHLLYEMPTGTTIRKVSLDYLARSGPQAVWEVYNDDQAAAEAFKVMEFVSSSSGDPPVTGTFEVTLSQGDTESVTLKLYPVVGTTWATGQVYDEDGDAIVLNRIGARYTCHATHTSSASTEPGYGASWSSYWANGGATTGEQDQNDYAGLYGMTAYGNYHTDHSAFASPSYTTGEIAQDVLLLAAGGDLSTDISLLGEPGTALEAFITTDDGFETADSIFQRLAAYSDTSLRTWGVSVWGSNTSSDGLPQVEFTYRDVSTWDYAVRMAELASFSPEESEEQLFNWITVRWTDSEGAAQYLSPDDDATLKDDTSIARWGRRHNPTIDIGQATGDKALQVGQRYLEYHKDPLNKTGLSIKGFITTRYGQRVPVNQVRAGQRVKVLDYQGGTTYFLRETSYASESDTLTASSDLPPDTLMILMSQERGG